MDALDHDDLIPSEPDRAVMRDRGARFEVKARHRDLFPGDEPRKVVRQPCKIHALRTFEIGYPVLVIHRLLIVGRRAVIVIHREHVRVHAGQLDDACDPVVRRGLARGRRAVDEHDRTVLAVAHDLVRRHVYLAVIVLLAVADEACRIGSGAAVDIFDRVFRHNTPSLH